MGSYRRGRRSDPASSAENQMTIPVLSPMAADEIRNVAENLLRFELNDLECHLSGIYGTPTDEAGLQAVWHAKHHLDGLRAALQVLAR
jgi:hypothetical protein